MAAFRELLEQSGCTGVRTLLNSGNAAFARPDRSPPALADRIRAARAQRLAVDVPVIVKSRTDLAAVVAGNGIARVATERFLVGAHAAYLWCPDGLLASKAAAAHLPGIVTFAVLDAVDGTRAHYDMDVRLPRGDIARIKIDAATREIGWRKPAIVAR